MHIMHYILIQTKSKAKQSTDWLYSLRLTVKCVGTLHKMHSLLSSLLLRRFIMKQFDRDVIAKEEDAYYALLLTKSRKEWIDLYLKKVRPNYEGDIFWKHRETIADENMPVDAERIYIKARDGYALPELIYRPKNSEGCKLPTLFQIHGGGWVMGVPELNNAECCRYRDEAGVQVINLGHRLAPEWEFPYAPEDCYDGIKYFTAHADEYGIDTERLGVGGESAGAELAIDMVMLANDRKDFNFKMQLLSYPNVNLGYVAEDVMVGVAPDPGFFQDFYITSPVCYCDPSQLRNPLISPLFAHDRTLAAMPTTVLMTCEFDQLRPQAEDWAHRLIKNGVKTIVKCVEGTAHGFSLSAEGCDPKKVKEGIDFLIDGLKNYLV